MKQATVIIRKASARRRFLDSNNLAIKVKLRDTTLIGKQATLAIERRVYVKDERPVNHFATVFKKTFTLTSMETTVPANSDSLQSFSYQGKMINIELHTVLRIDDSIFFDSKIEEKQQLNFSKRPKISSSKAKSIIDPADDFSFIKNMQAIPSGAQMLVAIFGLVTGAFLIVNTIVGVHDQFVAEALTWFYSHYESDGDSTSPLMNAMGINALAIGACWWATRKQLQRYMRFHLKFRTHFIKPGKLFRVKDLISGVPRVPLQSAELRIVACNMEHGKYVRGSGTNRREVSFAEPVRAITIYKKKVNNLQAGTDFSWHFPEVISFDPVYDNLYPKQMNEKSHGLDVYWEVQFLHSEYVDHELVGPTSAMKYQYFLPGDNYMDQLGVIDLDKKDKNDAA